MQKSDLEPFRDLPFLFWVKDLEGRYVWGNRAINELAGRDVAGLKDSDLEWAENADALYAEDKRVMSNGKPEYLHEYADETERGKVVLSVCKWPGELDGAPHCFGISFVIEGERDLRSSS